jgi:ferrous iron transport protein B
MVVIYVFTQFPELNQETRMQYENEANQAVETFEKQIGEDSAYGRALAGPKLMEFVRYSDEYRWAKVGAKDTAAKEAVDQKFSEENFEFFKIANRGRYKVDGKVVSDREATKVTREYKKLARERTKLRQDIKEQTLIGSSLGWLGRSLEPVTRFAGFNWRINIGLISSFAAKENAVGVLGSIYQSDGGERLEERVSEKERDWTPLHALAMILFMAMYPPCIPTLLMIRVEAGIKWMLLAAIYPIALGAGIAILVFSGGSILGLNGIQAMFAFYGLAIAIMVVMGFLVGTPGMAEEGR